MPDYSLRIYAFTFLLVLPVLEFHLFEWLSGSIDFRQENFKITKIFVVLCMDERPGNWPGNFAETAGASQPVVY